MTQRACLPKCLTCNHRLDQGPRQAASVICTSAKLHECNEPSESDHLVYQYTEGGYFMPGDDFGCVHHTDYDDNQPSNGKTEQ